MKCVQLSWNDFTLLFLGSLRKGSLKFFLFFDNSLCMVPQTKEQITYNLCRYLKVMCSFTVYLCKNMRIPDTSIFHKHMYIFLMLHAKKVYKHARSPRSIILLHEKHKQDVVCLDYLCIFPKICMFFMCMY